MNKLPQLLLCLLLIGALAACGQKGPLYLPGGGESAATSPGAAEEEQDGT